MKRILPIFLILFLLLPLSGCRTTYTLRESANTITQIELVSAEDCFEYTVVKTLSETEKEDFLNRIQYTEFRRRIGDPIRLRGDSIKITYESGNYDIICGHASEYVKDGERYYNPSICDKDAFVALFNDYSD